MKYNKIRPPPAHLVEILQKIQQYALSTRQSGENPAKSTTMQHFTRQSGRIPALRTTICPGYPNPANRQPMVHSNLVYAKFNVPQKSPFYLHLKNLKSPEIETTLLRRNRCPACTTVLLPVLLPMYYPSRHDLLPKPLPDPLTLQIENGDLCPVPQPKLAEDIGNIVFDCAFA